MRDGLVRGDLFSRPQDHYSALPNIVWGLGLTACELATYMYLIFRENRQTYRCHPSYEEIGRAIGRDKRSVPKYIGGLVEKRLIEVEPTTLTLADGTRCNGTLEYHLLNPRIAVDHFNAQALSSGGLRVPKVRRTRPRREKRPEKNPVPYMAVDDEENELPPVSRQCARVWSFQTGPDMVPIPDRKPPLGPLRPGFPTFCEDNQGSRRSLAKRVRWEKEEQRSKRFFAACGGNERYGACDDAKQDKRVASEPGLPTPHLPAVRAETAVPKAISITEKKTSRRYLDSHSVSCAAVFGDIHRQNGGKVSNNTTTRDTFPFRPKPETMRRIEQWYQADNCRSKNEFIEKAVNYYANALAAKDIDRLPVMVAAALDSRLGTFEDRLSSLLFKQAVELDTLAQLNAAAYEFDEASLRDLRAKSVQTVKATHGRISFEQRAREAEAARYGDDEAHYEDEL